MLRIGIVAGEVSGDYLAANLVRAIRAQRSDLEIVGIGGPDLAQAGCKILFPMEKLAVMGIVEVIGRIFELSRMRRQLVKYYLANPPDIFIGVDAPDFNLSLERKLRKHGVKTVHYVSPSVWAWRSYRVKKIVEAVDLMVTLFPFEQEFYNRYRVPVFYAGHPLAEKIDLQPDKLAARRRLDLPGDKITIAIMPGSRRVELNRLLLLFLEAAALVIKEFPDIEFITSLNDERAIEISRESWASSFPELPLSFFSHRAHDVLEAADVVLLASGTITLEAMLFKRPMVVAYKLNWLSHRIVKALAIVKHAALPNLLAGSEIVPECLQDDCCPARLARELIRWLTDTGAVANLEKRFTELHHQLKSGAGDTAAAAEVLKLLDVKP